MPDTPEFLPPELNLDGTGAEVLAQLYAVFCRDFKDSSAYHKGILVVYNSKIVEGKEKGFWHVISQDVEKSVGRVLDYPRARRLPWARPLMESGKRPEIKIWQYQEGTRDRGIRTYIWLEDYDYIVVLQQKKTVFYWVTAFCTESEGYRRTLRKKYEKRL